MKNSGDDAFLEVSAWGASTYWNVRDISFWGSDLPQIQRPANSLKKSSNKFFAYYDKFQKLICSTHFISAGGSTFHSVFPQNDIRRSSLSKKHIFKKYKVGAIGVSIGPFKNTESESFIFDHLKRMDFLALRDKRSYEIALSINLPYKPIQAFDLAALLPKVYSDTVEKVFPRNSEKKIIGISLCNVESYVRNGDLENEKRRNNKISELLVHLAKNNAYRLCFFVFNGSSLNGDLSLTREMIEKLKSIGFHNYEIVPYLGHVQNTWTEIKKCDLVISTRLHAGIFACYANIPFFLVEYHRKCTDFLEDVGQNDKYRIFDADFSVAEIHKEINEILMNDNYLKPTKIYETQQLSTKNFTETKAFFE